MKVKKLMLIGLLMASACAPRGESKSIEEILSLAKDRYTRVSGVSVSKEVRADLDMTVKQMGSLLSGGKTAGSAEEIAQLIDELLPHASFTVRPGLTELMTQFGELADTDADVPESTLKLLVSRTYSSLASELETGRFTL